ncbi:MAG: tetratricopeptide repeat protein, partial [Blastocatellia bacterium]
MADAKQRLSHLKEVDVALNVSYEMLNEEQRRLWRALSVFPQTFDDEAAAAVWEMERDAAQEALGDLMKWSLVEFNDETRRYRLHDLARLFAETRLSKVGAEETDVAQRRFARHYQLVLAACNSLYKKGHESVLRGLALFDQEWGNIQAGRAWAEAKIEKDREAAQLCIDYPDAGADVLELRQHPRERIHWQEVWLAAAQQLKRRDHEGTALGNLGLAWAALGETRRAIGFHKQSIAIAREIGNRRGEGIALGNLGSAHYALGETRRAIEFYEQARAIIREIGDKNFEATIYNHLGLAWAHLGEPHKAIE